MRARHLMVGIASLGGLLFGYETGITAGALERGESSWLSTATLIGALIGALAAGRRRYGMKKGGSRVSETASHLQSG